jgi:hypothetical protein
LAPRPSICDKNCPLICRVPFSCCSSVAWPRAAFWPPSCAPRSSLIRQSRVSAGSGLNTGLSTKAKYLRCTASGAARNGLGPAIKYLRRTTNGVAGYGLARSSTCDKQLPPAAFASVPFGFVLLAPHTSGPRDVPRCGALSLLLKTPHYRGDQKISARLNAKMWIMPAWWWWYLSAISPNPALHGN